MTGALVALAVLGVPKLSLAAPAPGAGGTTPLPTVPTSRAGATAPPGTSTPPQTSVPGGTTTTTSTAPTALAGRQGYWLVRSDGAVAHDGTHYYGDLSGSEPASPIVGAAATPDGDGYWLAAANGGIYVFGDARFLGSAGSLHLRRPIVAMAATPDGGGYWLVASDGGIFAYGDAGFYGSTGGMRLKRPIVAIATTPDGRGYWEVASDGGIFAFGDAGFYGSTGRYRLAQPVRAIAPTPDGRGYWLADQDGTVYAFGDAPVLPRPGGQPDRAPVVALMSAQYAQPGPSFATTTTTVARTTTTVARTTTTVARTTTTPTSLPSPTTSTTVPVTTTRPVPTTTTVPVTLTTAPGTGPAHPYAAGTTGYDVSWPQCRPRGSATTVKLPSSGSFAVVGVNDGQINDFNPCFQAEAAWAGPNMSVYTILQPEPTAGPMASTGPRAACAGTSSTCRAYDWGYNYAEADLSFVLAQGYAPVVWWLDVELGEGWSTAAAARPVNAAVVQGALDALKAAGRTVGIYSTWFQWGLVTGSYLPPGGQPIWVAGAQTLTGGTYSARSYCQRALVAGDPSTLSSATLGFAGGVPWLVQYGYGPGTSPIDPNYAC